MGHSLPRKFLVWCQICWWMFLDRATSPPPPHKGSSPGLLCSCPLPLAASLFAKFSQYRWTNLMSCSAQAHVLIGASWNVSCVFSKCFQTFPSWTSLWFKKVFFEEVCCTCSNKRESRQCVWTVVAFVEGWFTKLRRWCFFINIHFLRVLQKKAQAVLQMFEFFCNSYFLKLVPAFWNLIILLQHNSK